MTVIAAGSKADRLRNDGYVVVEQVLTAAQCDAMREHVLVTTDEAARQKRNDLFGNIQEAENRYDLKLDTCDPVVEALNSFVDRCGPALTEVMGPLARLVELAAITSDGGAAAQPVHADTMHGVTRFLQSDIQVPDSGNLPEQDDADDEDDAAEDLGEVIRAVATETALIYTALIALQDVEPDMGPTHVWPGTNTVEQHAVLWGTHVGGKLSVADADGAFGVEHLKMTIKKGDLLMYDSRTMHCGGANSSDKRRSVMVVSVMGPGIRPDGTTWTMLASLRNRLRLADFPLPQDHFLRARATANTYGASVVLPALPADGAEKAGPEPEAGGAEVRLVPDLEEWEATVQCADCGKWRPCTAMEAPKLTANVDVGFRCKDVGFSCSQDQRYTSKEIDEIFS